MPDASWKLVGHAPRGMQVGFGDFVGRVTRVLQSGCGFVDCPEIWKRYGNDAYIPESIVDECVITVGDKIAFNVHITPDGHPQVLAPLWKKTDSDGAERPAIRRPAGIPSPPRKRSLEREVEPERAPSWKRRAVDDSSWGKSDSTSGSSWKSWGSRRQPSQEGHMYVGWVIVVDLQRGFSMVSCPDSGYDRDVFVHKTTAHPKYLEKDAIVAFKIHLSPKGMPQASGAFWILVGRHSRSRLPEFAEHQGIIRRIKSNGNAFVDCPDLSERYGRDAFVHISVIEQCGLETGDHIAFSAHVSQAGNPQVSAPCWRRCWPEEEATEEVTHQRERAPWYKESKGAPFPALPPPPREPREPREPGGSTGSKGDWRNDNGGRPRHWEEEEAEQPRQQEQQQDVRIGWLPGGLHLGWVSRTDDQRGMSKVTCLDRSQEHEVYVHRSVAEPVALSVGDLVAFPIHMNSKGLPQASAPFWKQVGWTYKGRPIEFGRYQGLVARVLPNGCAFVNCKGVTEKHDRDAYIHQVVMNQCDLVEGNFIAFNVHISSMGYPQVSAPCWICCSDNKWMRDIVPATLTEHPRSKRHKRSSSEPYGSSEEEEEERSRPYGGNKPPDSGTTSSIGKRAPFKVKEELCDEEKEGPNEGKMAGRRRDSQEVAKDEAPEAAESMCEAPVSEVAAKRSPPRSPPRSPAPWAREARAKEPPEDHEAPEAPRGPGASGPREEVKSLPAADTEESGDEDAKLAR